MSSQLVVATANTHKVEEIRAILAPYLTGAQLARIVPLGAFTDAEPAEDGLTFLENSLIKARAATEATGQPSLADDSGICVDVLGGSPGIFSARWCGIHGDDAGNRELLLAQLEDVAAPNRGCEFVSVVSLVTPGEPEQHARGVVRGRLTTSEHGSGGFGYDPIFIPDGYGHTTAQLSPQEKNELSHRGIAIRKLVPQILALLGED